MKKTILLLTACIDPRGMKYTVLQDVEERKRQYKRAIDYYLANTKYRIVFCDNSGADLAELVDHEYNNRIELLSFMGNDFDNNYGKGYGEYLIIQYAFSHSRFIQKASSLIKITGRLIVEELPQVERLNTWVFGHPKSYVFLAPFSLNGNDSRCFIASKDFFSQFFLATSNTINDSNVYYFEHFLHDVVACLPSTFIIADFVLPLRIIGSSGSTGKVYRPEELSVIDKLVAIRGYCQKNKRYYKSLNKYVYYRMKWVSLVARFQKAVAIRIGA